MISIKNCSAKFLFYKGCAIDWSLFLFMLFGLSVGFILARFGLCREDEPYQVLNAIYYKDAPFVPLFAYMSHLFGETFGYDLINFRYLAICLVTMSIICSGIYFYHKTKAAKSAMFIIGIVGLLSGMLKNAWFNQYSWDGPCILFATLTVILLINYTENPQWYKIMLISVVSALLTMSRMPGILVVPISMGTMLFCHRKNFRKLILAESFYLIFFVGLSAIILLVIYGNINNYWTAISENSIAAHGLRHLVERNLTTLYRVAPIVCMIICAFLLKGVGKIYGNLMSIIFMGLIVLCLPFIYPFYTFLTAAFLALLIIVLHCDYRKLGLPMVIILGCGYITACGSNLGLNKYLTLPLVPILCVYFYDKIKIRNFAILLSFVVFCIFVDTNSKPSYYDAPPKDTQITVDVPGLNGLKTTYDRAHEIESIWVDFQQYFKSSDYGIYVVGTPYHRFLYEYLFKSRNGMSKHDWDPTDHQNSQEYVDFVQGELEIKKSPAAILLLKNGDTEGSKLYKLLKDRCMMVKEVDGYAIFISQ